MSITKGKTKPWAIPPAAHPYAGRIITGMLTTPEAPPADDERGSDSPKTQTGPAGGRGPV